MLDLSKLGFKNTYSCNGREFYENGIIGVIEHQGHVYLDKQDGNFYSNIEFKTNEDIIQYIEKSKSKLENTIKSIQKKINSVNVYLKKHKIQ